MNADDFGIVVGINHYPELGNLGGPENDARDFREWLISTEGGAVPPDNVTLITCPQPPASSPWEARPTTVELDTAFERLLVRADEEGRGGFAGRRLYIFLAGHGFAQNIEDAALLMANAGKTRTGHHIPGRPYANSFREAAYFREVVLFMDCCRENYRKPVGRKQPPWDEERNPSRAINVRHFYGFATEWSRAAREMPHQPDLQVRGHFTTALLAGLRGGAADEHGRITGKALKNFVLNYLPSLLPPGQPQVPVFDFDDTKDIEFGTTRIPRIRVEIHLSGSNVGKDVLLRDGNLQPMPGTALRVSPELWEAQLLRGLYQVSIPGGESKMFQVLGDETGEVHVNL
ncbi:caspase domain-containing protein [Archangium gephyra]|uniref:Caspase domain-containing protein n=1 Tax=Archangium gephyra TaxID=48 RepID=A0AAC8Q9B2_9BACT|nr:caspase family protein [Archangium gephyra]AKJ03457.1 Hypothetical protein AA314_05083 [Archangium gephyra]REG24036.1 caspase domain-containing protein [Archangium gephyra]